MTTPRFDRRTRAALVLAALVTSPAAAQDAGEPAPEEIERPGFKFLRYQEDWSVLRDVPAEARTFWDPIKYVPLSDDGSIWASFGGSMRWRFESWRDFGFGTASDPDDSFLLFRALLHADVHLGKNVRGFIEGKTAQSTSRDLPGGHRTLDVDSLDLQQGFVDLTFRFDDGNSLTLRPGRQELLLGKQRLVSPLGWSNTLRTWDGVSAILQYRKWQVTAFWAQFAAVQKYSFNDPDAQTQLYGVYGTGKLFDTSIDLDLYFLGYDKDDRVTFNGTTGTEERYTVGGRLFGPFGKSTIDYDFEGAYQFGEVGSGDVSAFMIGSELGWRLPGVWAEPRLFLGFDYASGDNRAGGDVHTFNQLFPLGHAYLGYIDTIGRQNIAALSGGVSLTPLAKLSVRCAGHFFWRADDDDALYDAGGAVVRAGNLGDAREVGQEIDLTVGYRFDQHLAAELGYSHFFASSFIEQSGASSDIDFVYVQLGYTF